MALYSPLADHVVYTEKFSAGYCGVPHCHQWMNGRHGLCEFHEKLANRQAGEPWPGADHEDATPEELDASYAAHRDRHLRSIPYHLIMASIWPGPYAEARSRSTRRDSSQRAKWQEENDR